MEIADSVEQATNCSAASDGDAAGVLRLHPLRHHAVTTGLAVYRFGLGDHAGMESQRHG
jgi:hypothetical protein